MYVDALVSNVCVAGEFRLGACNFYALPSELRQALTADRVGRQQLL